MSTILEMYGLNNHYINSNVPSATARVNCVVGAELELEDIRECSNSWCGDNNIGRETDGSLRNNGYEFLLPPRTVSSSVELFKNFHENAVVLGPEALSFRTSTHVHMNCMYMTPEQVKTFLYLYVIFEPLCFAFVAKERMNNIHCVPLGYTNLPNWYAAPLEVIVSKWHKYTALNLLPLKELGTLEFRHLQGTNNPDVYAAWLAFIETLFNNALTLPPFTKARLMETAWLQDIERQLITPAFRNNAASPIKYRLSDNLLDIKLAFI